MPRFLVAVVGLLALGLPALAQEASDAERAERIAELIDKLGDPAAPLGKPVASALAEIGPPALPALAAAISHPNPAVRAEACVALRRIGPGAAAAVPPLAGALSDENTRVRRSAALALSSIGAVSAVSALIAALSDEDSTTRCYAANALYALGPKAAPGVPALTHALSDKDADVRLAAAHALASIGGAAGPAIPALITLWSDESEDIRARAPGLTGRIGVELKKTGTILWWVVPRVYWTQLVGLLLLLVGWYALAARFARRRPASNLRQAAFFVFTAAVPAGLACSALGYAVTRDWAQGFLPDPVLTVVPFAAAATLSTGFVCVLAAVGICWREQPAMSEEGTAPRVPPAPSD